MTETERIDEALNLKDIELPSGTHVTRLKWESVEDSTGDESVEVWVLLDDNTKDEEIEGEWVQHVRMKILDNFRRAKVAWFPYVHFAREGEWESWGTHD